MMKNPVHVIVLTCNPFCGILIYPNSIYPNYPFYHVYGVIFPFLLKVLMVLRIYEVQLNYKIVIFLSIL